MLEQSIEVEYKKTGIKPSDIAVLKEWVQSQPHLPAEYITDLDLILNYYSCNQSTEVAKQTLDLNLTLRTLFNIFNNRCVDDNLLKILKSIVFVRLPVPKENQFTVVYFRIRRNSTQFDFADIVRAGMMHLDIWQYEDGTWPGIIIVVDLTEFTTAHLTRINLAALRNILYYLQEALYMKIKGFHFINIPSYMDKIMSVIRPFMKKELLEIIQVHQTGSKTIDDTVPQKYLPKELGGELGTLEEIQNKTVTMFLENKEYFINESKKRVQECLRPGKPKTISDIFGSVEGSFKKLDID